MKNLVTAIVVAILGYAFWYFDFGGDDGSSDEVNLKNTSGSIVADGQRWTLANVEFVLGHSEDETYYYINADVVEGSETCMSDISKYVSFYGTAPSFSQPMDVQGDRLPIEFSGDGDDAHLCLPDMGTFLWALPGSEIVVDRIEGDIAYLTFSGSFEGFVEGDYTQYSTPIDVSGQLKARVKTEEY